MPLSNILKNASLVPPLTTLSVWDDSAVPRSGPLNMAVDEALLVQAAAERTAMLRIYTWDRPTLSFGYFLQESAARAECRRGEAMVRRWTGGGLVHHEAAVTWSLAVPHTDPFCLVRPALSYARLHQALADCLADHGFQNLAVMPSTHAAPAGGPCAESVAPGDLLRDQQKIAGAGQRRTRLGLLHQAVLFLQPDSLPENFMFQLGHHLAPTTGRFRPPPHWPIPTARYADPRWNSLR